ncbi:MAG TPA: chaperonin GroEL [Chloroflexi bacterium]|jgi:chaperonin GroEL|nr:chaperonin GroEL [Chloroflexota bacterium]
MPEPDVLLGEKGRVGMLRGFTSIAKLLSITLGPIGGNIANAREPRGEPELLTDAATIARRIIQLPDRAEDAGAMLMRHMVWRVREEVGDGSATTAVLAQAIAREVEHVLAAGANAMMVRRGIERATDAAVQALDAMSVPLEGEDRIAAVATAATGDAEIGKILGEMYDVLGPDANIVIEPYIATYHDRAYHEGARFKGGYLSPYMLTDTVRRLVVLDDVYVLVADMAFNSTESVQNVLEHVVRQGGKNVLIICKLMSDKAIGVLVANSERGVIRSCAANMKPVGDLRRGTVENIAALTGGQPLTDKSGMAPEAIQATDIGHADRVVVTKDYFMIIGGDGDRQAVRDRIRQMRARLREATDPEERTMLRELLAQLSGGVGELRIGALTEKDRKALTEVAEQAMKAVQAGMESGIVPGGGAAYLRCIPALKELQATGDEAMGIAIMARALEEPTRCIAANAGVHPPLAIAEALRAGPDYGFDVRRKAVVNMVEAGIVDPTRVVRRALQLAASGAMMLLTTDALVLHRKPQETFEP